MVFWNLFGGWGHGRNNGHDDGGPPGLGGFIGGLFGGVFGGRPTIGTRGDDTFVVEDSQSRIFGRKGEDAVEFSGSYFDYEIDRGWFGKTYVTGDEGSYTLRDVEVLRFDDATYFNDGRNNAPITRPDAVATSEGGSLTLGAADLLANDTDPEGDDFGVTGVGESAAGASVDLTERGEVVYNTDGAFDALSAGETTVDSFTYTVTDARGASRTETVTVEIEGVNDAPEAADDSATASAGSGVTIDVLGNDTDVDGDTLSVASVDTSGTTGTVSQTPDGTLGYDPDGQYQALGAGETATDSFGYTVADGNGGTDTATVTVEIEGVNDAPEAADDSATASAGSGVTIDVLGNDTDVDGDTLSVASVDTSGTTGTVSQSPDGTLGYDPDGQYQALGAGETATDSFGYTVADGNGGTDSATVTVEIEGVNDAPEAAGDSATTDEDTAVTIAAASLLDNDGDPDGDTLEVTAVDGSGTSGSVTFENGEIRYDPDGAFDELDDGESATDTFDYTVSDGNGGTATGTVSVSVEGVNDAPPPPPAPDYSISEEDILGPLTASDLGGDGNLSFEPTNDRVSLKDGPTATLTYNPQSAFDYLDEGEFARDSFTWSTDQGDSGRVYVKIDGVNDAPRAGADSFDVGEDDSVTFTEADLLANDADPEGDQITVNSIDTAALAERGSVEVSGDTITFDPGPSFQELGDGESDTVTFGVTVRTPDGQTDSTTGSIVVNGANDAPDAGGFTGTLNSGETIRLGLDDVFASDPEGLDTLDFVDVGGLRAQVGKDGGNTDTAAGDITIEGGEIVYSAPDTGGQGRHQRP